MILDLAGAATPAVPDGLMVAPADGIGRSPLLEGLLFAGGLSTPPPATFHATGGSGTRYTITFDWLAAHTVTITPQP